MVTTAVPEVSVKKAPSLPGRRFDHIFFSTMAALMLITVFVGFAHSYYFAGVFHAPLPSLIIHIHGAAFSCWMLLLITQTTLVSAGRVDIHRRLGIAGFVLACAMVILGVMAATDSLVREGGPPGRDAKFFLHCSYDIDADVWGAYGFCSSSQIKFTRAQTPDSGCDDRSHGRRPCPLARRDREPACTGSNTVFLYFSGHASGL